MQQFTVTMQNMNKVLLGVRGLTEDDATERVMKALKSLKGVSAVVNTHPGQLEVNYDPVLVTVMDLLRIVRGQGFLAGML
jgi:copper chaperone